MKTNNISLTDIGERPHTPMIEALKSLRHIGIYVADSAPTAEDTETLTRALDEPVRYIQTGFLERREFVLYTPGAIKFVESRLVSRIAELASESERLRQAMAQLESVRGG